jgi:myo-inositol-1(or 4)-monophosphatase
VSADGEPGASARTPAAAPNERRRGSEPTAQAHAQTAGELADQLLAIASQQARSAGELLLERFRSGVERAVHTKSTPTDLVSDADIEAERHIREGIARARPGDGMLGEEGDDRPSESGLRWVVDPLDGTVNFIFAIPHWAVSVAVQDAHGTLAGAVFDPLREELFTAVRGGEPALNGQPIRASRCAQLATAMVATGFNYDARVREQQARILQRLIGRARDIRRFGAAALDLAWTAAGRYDAYYERGVHLWDVAAGLLICERAGLHARELSESARSPWGVLVAPPALVEELLGLVA